MDQIISKDGFDSMIQEYKMDDEGRVYLDNWLSDSKADVRKEYLKQYQLNIDSI